VKLENIVEEKYVEQILNLNRNHRTNCTSLTVYASVYKKYIYRSNYKYTYICYQVQLTLAVVLKAVVWRLSILLNVNWEFLEKSVKID
jgi:hypothetical protein